MALTHVYLIMRNQVKGKAAVGEVEEHNHDYCIVVEQLAAVMGMS